MVGAYVCPLRRKHPSTVAHVPRYIWELCARYLQSVARYTAHSECVDRIDSAIQIMRGALGTLSPTVPDVASIELISKRVSVNGNGSAILHGGSSQASLVYQAVKETREDSVFWKYSGNSHEANNISERQDSSSCMIHTQGLH